MRVECEGDDTGMSDSEEHMSGGGRSNYVKKIKRITMRGKR